MLLEEITGSNFSILGSKFPTPKALYKQSNRIVIKSNKYIYFFVAKLSPVGFIFPKAIVSCIIYFTSDLGGEALELPLPWW